jgi:methionyl-tRNA formyltransferase
MRIVMMGTGTFAEPTFQALIAAGERVVGLVTQPERDAGNKRGSTRQTGLGMASIAAAAGIPVIQPESINTPEGVAALRAFEPDLLVVAAYGQILKPEVIAAPKLGAINVHASLLPKYRGASPIAHAIRAGETVSGVTIIRITLGLDAGDMLKQESLDIDPRETTGELEARLAPLGARLCLDVIREMKLGPVSGVKQDPALVTKAPKFKKEHGLIDWSKPATEIVNHIRAMQPWPTAFTFFLRPGHEPMRVIIGRATALTEEVGEAGAQLAGLRIGTGVGTLQIEEIQPAGKKKMSAAEFLRGYPMKLEHRFGNS